MFECNVENFLDKSRSPASSRSSCELKLSCCFDVGIALAWYLRVLELMRSEEQNHDHTISAMSSAMSSSSGNTTPECRARLTARLRGPAIVVPDVLQTIYNCPTVRLNDTEFLAQHLDIWLEKYVLNVSQGAIQEKSNTPLTSSYFWTRVPKDNFIVLSCFLAWFFLWDDEIDCGSLTFDKGTRTDDSCNDEIAFIRNCTQSELNPSRPAPGRFHNSESLDDIALAMQDGQTRADRDCFLDALFACMNSICASQAQWQVGLDSVQDFIGRRLRPLACIRLCTHMPKDMVSNFLSGSGITSPYML
jgi:hypothetical protein